VSFFGKNIKKIRTVKKLSQTEFAKLFKLKRGSIGAYEEGRAEAKLDTIISIAEHFKLSLNQLLTSELTINEIYHINKINNKLHNSNFHKNSIPFVTQTGIKEFTKNYANENYLANLSSISLPNIKQTNIAFECFDSSMLGLYSGFKQGDILLSQSIKLNELSKLANKNIIIVLSDDKLAIGFSTIEAKRITLSPLNLNFQKQHFNKKGLKGLWLIKKVITDSFIKEETLEQRIQEIEHTIKHKLRNPDS
jgi:transcriptional regulator with XRE-family HTH domain